MKALIAMGLGLIVGMVLPVAGQDAPPRQEIYITVTNRKELLVKPNQQVTEGQVLADNRGTTARRIATLQLQQQIYSQPTIKPLPPVEPPPIAKPSFLKEETLLSQLDEQIKAQQEIINTLPDDPNIVTHEQAKLKMLTQERLIRQGELDTKKYQYSLDLNRTESIKQSQQQDYQRQLAIWQKNEQERLINLAKLQLEIDDIRQQETLIRSPYAGVIQKVIWQAQRGNRLDVLLILLPTSPKPRTTLPDQSSRLLGGLALLGDPKFTGITGTRYCPIRTR
jgi:multidrug efflux pump subunit AcrA (membrane-fusion protein)